MIEAVEKGLDVVMDITVPGSLAILERFPEAIDVFLLPPSFSELRRRLAGRGTEDTGVIEKRLVKAVDEVGKASKFEYVVVNEDSDRTARTIFAIIEAERHRYKRMAGVEDRILKR